MGKSICPVNDSFLTRAKDSMKTIEICFNPTTFKENAIKHGGMQTNYIR